MLNILIFFPILLVATGVISLVPQKDNSLIKGIVPVSIAISSLTMLAYILLSFSRLVELSDIVFSNWQLPFAKFIIGIDTLSAFFMLPLLILISCSAFYGPKYFAKHPAKRTHWFFYSLLVTGMTMVLISRNVILFLISWEIMSISSFFLVISDTRNTESMQAGWIYFITAHIGTAFLFALFFLISNTTGSFDFASWRHAELAGAKADLIFILAIIAFGLKAGFIPFHVWLPLAHPAAPSHVSALMSGIMIKMGIYGILRILSFILPYHSWWGFLLIGIGVVSGILGVLFAIGQHDIKRLLAYHSVENIGIILLGIGLGIVGVTYNSMQVAILGFAGGFLHIINHSLFKGLLFMGAGAIIRQTGTGEIDRLGGLLKTMPKTGFLFLVGATAICGLPFFNGFISELMIYAGSIEGVISGSQQELPMISLITILSLTIIGGLAAACFTKVFGIVFLGEPRNPTPYVKNDVPSSMIASMGILATLCFLIGIGSPLVIPFLIPSVISFSNFSSASVDTTILYNLTRNVSIILGICLSIIIVVASLRLLLLRKQDRRIDVTWDCGYCLPDPSMQYTASSFAAPIMDYFARLVSLHRKVYSNQSLLPTEKWKFHSTVNDWVLTKIFIPLFKWSDKAFASLRWFQSGKSGQYVLYILIIVCFLIIWKLFL